MHHLIALSSVLAITSAFPQRNRNGNGRNGGGRTQQATAQQQAGQVPQGISTAQDGSTILDDTVMVKYASSWPIPNHQHHKFHANPNKAASQSAS
jgi:hypothetical protein